MRARSLRGIRALVFAALVLRWTPVAPQRDDLDAAEVCADFTAEGYPGSAWTFVDCAQVWAHFVDTLLPYVRTRAPHVDIWRDTAKELRRIGSPCIVSSLPTRDGAGSSTIRHLATWVLSIEMGCDWATPSWGGSPPVPGANGATMYCHRTATTAEMDLSRPAEELWAMRRCSIVNWLAYFQFDVPSVDLPVNKTSDILLKVRALRARRGPQSKGVVKTCCSLKYVLSPGKRPIVLHSSTIPSTCKFVNAPEESSECRCKVHQ